MRQVALQAATTKGPEAKAPSAAQACAGPPDSAVR
jgi:hypothetical protein